MSGTPEMRSESTRLADLIKDLRDEGIVLLRQEVALARAEIAEKARVVARQSISLAIGAAVLFAGLIVLLIGAGDLLFAALVEWGVHPGAAIWLGPVLVGLLCALVGIGLVMKAKSALSRESLIPDRTAHSLKEDKEWIRSKLQRT